MKTMYVAAVLAAVIGAAAGAQSPSVVLQNQEDSTFYYVIDPKELVGLSAGSPLLASKVAGYFSTADSTVTFAALAPQAETKLTDLPEGVHMLVGFFAQLDADSFPVRVVALQADSTVGERFYAVFANPAQVNVPRGIGKLAQFARPAAAGGTAVATATGTTDTAATDTAAGAGADRGWDRRGGADRVGPRRYRDILQRVRPGRIHAREQSGFHGPADRPITFVETDRHQDRLVAGGHRLVRA